MESSVHPSTIAERNIICDNKRIKITSQFNMPSQFHLCVVSVWKMFLESRTLEANVTSVGEESDTQKKETRGRGYGPCRSRRI